MNMDWEMESHLEYSYKKKMAEIESKYKPSSSVVAKPPIDTI